MEKKLNGKVALITGGNSGIGLATAQLFQSHGARLAISGRDADRLDTAGALLGSEALLIRSDARRLEDIGAMLQSVDTHFRRLDVLFLNAGAAVAAPIEHTTEAMFDEQIAVNLKAVYFTVQKALPLMSAGSSIVVTTSICNQIGSPGLATYSAAKAGLRALVKSLGLELIGKGIRINAVSPGPIDTPIFDRIGLPPEQAAEKRRNITERSPMHRFGRPDEVAKAALFLASEDSSYMIGEEVVVDGGMSLL